MTRSILLVLMVAAAGLVGAEGDPAAAAAAVDAATTDTASEAANVNSGTMFDHFMAGGVPMWFLLGLSVLGLGIIIERITNLNKSAFTPKGLGAKADQLWQAGDYAAVAELGSKNGSALGKLIAFCAQNRGLTASDAHEQGGELVFRDVRRHQQTAYWLAVVATLSPLLGLLGTVLGMIDAFTAVAVAGDIGNMSQVAGGISKALVTTAAGLIIAVPALGFFHLFKVRTNRLSVILEDEGSALITSWFGPSSKRAEA